MLRLPPFEYRVARDLKEAAELLAENPAETRIVAGGTDLWPNMKRRHQSAKRVVSLARIAELSSVRGAAGSEIRVGAMTTLTAIEKHPLLRSVHPGFVTAVSSISAPVLRNMGTIGGNLCLDTRCTYYNQNEEWRRSIGYCMKAEGQTCWVAPGSPRCWAISASDSAPLLCAVAARVRLLSIRGERTIPVEELFVDDGIGYLAKPADEILVELILPAADGTRATYRKVRRRGSIDFPVLGVGAAVRVDEAGICRTARIFLGAVRSAPTRAIEAEEALIGKAFDEAAIAAAAAQSRKRAAPLDNTDYVVAWRKAMVEHEVRKALTELAAR